MYGLVNRALAEMVTADHGDLAPLALKAAGADHDTFHVTYGRR